MFRPATKTPAAGLLCFQQFQMAYVTNDLDRALPIMRDRYGLAATTVFSPAPGLPMRIALAWSGQTMYEVIDATGMGIDIYDKALPTDFAIRFHHIGVEVPDDAGWERLQQAIAAGSHPVDFSGDNEVARFAYVHAPELGHYVEYVQLHEQGRAFFASVAAN